MLRTTVIAALFAISVPGAWAAGAGDLDATFAGDGQVTTEFATDGYVAVVLPQPDGKTVLAGTLYNGFIASHALLRHLDTGALDPSFGSGGIKSQHFIPTNLLPFLHDAAQQPADGKIVVVSAGGSSHARMFARYETDGDLDPTFGSAGAVFLDVGTGNYDALAVQPDGKIVMATRNIQGNLAVVRLLSNGDLDPGFGIGGIAVVPTPVDNDGAVDLIVEPDGKIVVAGSIHIDNPRTGALLVRVDEDGVPDAGFGTAGVVVVDPTAFIPPRTDCSVRLEGMVRRPDGRIATAGSVRCLFEPRITGTVLTQHLTDGSLDPSFGDGGLVAPAVTEPGAMDLALDADGRLIVARGDVGAARYDAEGFLDPTFGVGGATVEDTPEPSFATAIAVRSDGKVMVGGVTVRPEGEPYQHITVARRLTACPAAPDADGDSIGDACDRCTDGGVLDRARFIATNQTTPIGDDGYQVKGQFVVANPGSADPPATGVRVSLQDQLGRGLVEVLVPPGGFDPETNAGWTARVKGGSTVFKYVNKGNRIPLVDGVSNVSVKVGADGSVGFKLKAKNAEMPIDPARLPGDLAVILDPARAETGLCGEIAFDGVSGSCVFSASGRKLVCR